MNCSPDADDAIARLTELVTRFSPSLDALFVGGRITEIGADHFRVAGLGHEIAIRDLLLGNDGATPVAEVTHINANDVFAFPCNRDAVLQIGQRVFRKGPLTIAPTRHWLGRIVDAFGSPIDGRGALRKGEQAKTVYAGAPPALCRRLVTQGIRTGVKVVDLFTPLCAGQRLGIFAGSGVGKSTLLGMLADADGFDVIVVGLIGERGREVREFVETILGPRRKDTVIVVATGDESALLRRTAAHTAMTIAEHFRDERHSVLLLLDSVTRFALAAREIAIARGEPPVSRGFPPSVFTDLPRLLERSGPGPEHAGDITGIFAILVDGDDHNDPVADSVRGILDGHIVLDRAVAAQGRFPAVDIPASLSRLAHVALSVERRAFSARLRHLVSLFEDSRDMRSMGAYQPGMDADLDAAIAIVPSLYALLGQSRDTMQRGDVFNDVAAMLSAHVSSNAKRIS